MESRFGHDFTRVRVHGDVEADRSARALGARAFTVGQDIFFRTGAFAPDSLGGRHLLAHELAHVTQQDRSGGGSSPPRRSASGDLAETDADRAADAVTLGLDAAVSASPSAAIACEDDDDSIFSTIGDFLSLPTDVANVLEPVGTLGGVFGTMGSVDDMMTADDTEGVISGGAGVLGGILDLAKDFGEETLKGTTGKVLGGAAGMLDAVSSGIDAYSDFEKGEYGEGALDIVKSLGSSLSGLAEFGGFELADVAGTGALEALGGAGTSGLGVLGPIGAVLGAGVAGFEAGDFLAENTSVGDHSVETIGYFDQMLSEPGEEPWALKTEEAANQDWDEGNYLSAVGEYAELAGVGTLGALGGIGGGVVDALDYLNPFS
jgi:hypothetical protein